MKGIDVSKHNGSIDWGKAKAGGVEFAILRAGYGKDLSQKDPMFESNYKGAASAGIPVGAYWYSYADSAESAKKEAQACIEVIKGKRFEYPIYFDLEERSQFNKGKAFCDSLVKTFCGELEKTGYFAGLYCSTYWLTHYISKEVSDRYALWVAQYGSKCTYSVSPVGMWQYSSSGKINGVKGNVDLDECYRDYPGTMRAKGLNGLKQTEPKPSAPSKTEPKRKTVDELAREVLDGKWGNGTERKEKLTAAGYDYSAVQDAVNALLRVRTAEQTAREVLAGKWGNGDERRKRLTAAGYDYAEIQKLVIEMLK